MSALSIPFVTPAGYLKIERDRVAFLTEELGILRVEWPKS